MNDELSCAAFELAIAAYGAAGHCEAKERLRVRFPDADLDRIEKAYIAACRLHELAYTVADKKRDGIYSKPEALNQLRVNCPGFSEKTYSRALAQGLYESR